MRRAHTTALGARWTRKWHVLSELAAAGLWTTPTDLAKFAIEIQRRRSDDRQGADATSVREMLTPVGVGDTQRLDLEAGAGLGLGHGGSNWGFPVRFIAHRLKGYGVAIMTNCDAGRP